MTYSEADRQRIVEYLKIKPITSGHVHLAQLVLSNEPEATDTHVELVRHFQDNIYPVLIRPKPDETKDYDVYEVLYGSEWVVAAKQAGLQRVSAWTVDLDDAELEYLYQTLEKLNQPSSAQNSQNPNIQKMIQTELNPIYNELQSVKLQLTEILDRLPPPPPPPPPKKNIHEVTLAELENDPKSQVRKNATAIFTFIKNHSPIRDFQQFRTIYGIGPATVDYLEKHYRI